MKILQLCCFTNHWGSGYDVTSIDLRLGKNIFDFDLQPGTFDLVVSAPPCDQFTKVASWMWEPYPKKFIDIANRCLQLSLKNDRLWILENPPGRIEKFLDIKKYRLITWQSPNSYKEYVLYGNLLILNCEDSKGNFKSESFKSKKQREAWPPELIKSFKNSLQWENLF